jgi:hypothetical protein
VAIAAEVEAADGEGACRSSLTMAFIATLFAIHRPHADRGNVSRRDLAGRGRPGDGPAVLITFLVIVPALWRGVGPRAGSSAASGAGI